MVVATQQHRELITHAKIEIARYEKKLMRKKITKRRRSEIFKKHPEVFRCEKRIIK